MKFALPNFVAILAIFLHIFLLISATKIEQEGNNICPMPDSPFLLPAASFYSATKTVRTKRQLLLGAALIGATAYAGAKAAQKVGKLGTKLGRKIRHKIQGKGRHPPSQMPPKRMKRPGKRPMKSSNRMLTPMNLKPMMKGGKGRMGRKGGRRGRRKGGKNRRRNYGHNPSMGHPMEMQQPMMMPNHHEPSFEPATETGHQIGSKSVEAMGQDHEVMDDEGMLEEVEGPDEMEMDDGFEENGHRQYPHHPGGMMHHPGGMHGQIPHNGQIQHPGQIPHHHGQNPIGTGPILHQGQNRHYPSNFENHQPISQGHHPNIQPHNHNINNHHQPNIQHPNSINNPPLISHENNKLVDQNPQIHSSQHSNPQPNIPFTRHPSIPSPNHPSAFPNNQPHQSHPPIGSHPKPNQHFDRHETVSNAVRSDLPPGHPLSKNHHPSPPNQHHRIPSSRHLTHQNGGPAHRPTIFPQHQFRPHPNLHHQNLPGRQTTTHRQPTMPANKFGHHPPTNNSQAKSFEHEAERENVHKNSNEKSDETNEVEEENRKETTKRLGTNVPKSGEGFGANVGMPFGVANRLQTMRHGTNGPNGGTLPGGHNHSESHEEGEKPSYSGFGAGPHSAGHNAHLRHLTNHQPAQMHTAQLNGSHEESDENDQKHHQEPTNGGFGSNGGGHQGFGATRPFGHPLGLGRNLTIPNGQDSPKHSTESRMAKSEESVTEESAEEADHHHSNPPGFGAHGMPPPHLNNQQTLGGTHGGGFGAHKTSKEDASKSVEELKHSNENGHHPGFGINGQSPPQGFGSNGPSPHGLGTHGQFGGLPGIPPGQIGSQPSHGSGFGAHLPTIPESYEEKESDESGEHKPEGNEPKGFGTTIGGSGLPWRRATMPNGMDSPKHQMAEIKANSDETIHSGFGHHEHGHGLGGGQILGGMHHPQMNGNGNIGNDSSEEKSTGFGSGTMPSINLGGGNHHPIMPSPGIPMELGHSGPIATNPIGQFPPKPLGFGAQSPMSHQHNHLLNPLNGHNPSFHPPMQIVKPQISSIGGIPNGQVSPNPIMQNNSMPSGFGAHHPHTAGNMPLLGQSPHHNLPQGQILPHHHNHHPEPEIEVGKVTKMGEHEGPWKGGNTIGGKGSESVESHENYDWRAHGRMASMKDPTLMWPRQNMNMGHNLVGKLVNSAQQDLQIAQGKLQTAANLLEHPPAKNQQQHGKMVNSQQNHQPYLNHHQHNQQPTPIPFNHPMAHMAQPAMPPPISMAKHSMPPSPVAQNSSPPNTVAQNTSPSISMERNSMPPSPMAQNSMPPTSIVKPSIPPTSSTQHSMSPSFTAQQSIPPISTVQKSMPPASTAHNMMPPTSMAQNSVSPLSHHFHHPTNTAANLTGNLSQNSAGHHLINPPANPSISSLIENHNGPIQHPFSQKVPPSISFSPNPLSQQQNHQHHLHQNVGHPIIHSGPKHQPQTNHWLNMQPSHNQSPIPQSQPNKWPNTHPQPIQGPFVHQGHNVQPQANQSPIVPPQISKGPNVHPHTNQSPNLHPQSPQWPNAQPQSNYGPNLHQQLNARPNVHPAFHQGPIVHPQSNKGPTMVALPNQGPNLHPLSPKGNHLPPSPNPISPPSNPLAQQSHATKWPSPNNNTMAQKTSPLNSIPSSNAPTFFPTSFPSIQGQFPPSNISSPTNPFHKMLPSFNPNNSPSINSHNPPSTQNIQKSTTNPSAQFHHHKPIQMAKQPKLRLAPTPNKTHILQNKSPSQKQQIRPNPLPHNLNWRRPLQQQHLLRPQMVSVGAAKRRRKRK